MNVNLLQITDQALKASPFNAYAYGLLIAILISAVAALWLRLVKEQTERVQLIQKVTELMTKVLFSHEDDKELRKSNSEVVFEVRSFIKEYAGKESDLEKKIDKILEELRK